MTQKTKDPVFDNLQYSLYDKIENSIRSKEDIDLFYISRTLSNS